MKATPSALSAPFLAIRGRNLARFNLLKHTTKQSRRPKWRVKLSPNCKSRGRGFPSREVGLSTKLYKNDEASTPVSLFVGRESLLRNIALNDVTIILGETGSGKTTRMSPRPFFSWAILTHGFALELPQYLLEGGSFHGQIAVTQPRRVAATSIAARVSAERGLPLGTLVGYSVRFDDCVDPSTRIKYLTDGMLVREMMSDPFLTCYDAVIVDEAHERTLRTDIVLASLKRILALRNGSGADCNDKGKRKANPLKVVIMSATLDAEKFSKFFEKYVLWNSHNSKINTRQCPGALCQRSSASSVHISYLYQPK